ncbi:2-polyprenyl-6-methoxyphenol hydroxylase-like oxidoreductase [Frankia casuarinae]|jgi:salicylate hydroxylase|uniref:Salicylate 1-monooxygenase n=1 Tax=Frankia casuarinae (strain DSM 45818 / CECT 9043 / HFP020203 / CcI3) TaxID=106370 RepID=Q2J587_FRACC|nr:FAD-dependent monooxygenase [Frankia casuarinae]ABD13555.1 Salicylate 1-monooxygenase [Frankia casuarinae]EYT90635.1 2-polyprenyl-6-methoxyphenol hydroxylase-like oxidoreductase [Frankia casuarinae]
MVQGRNTPAVAVIGAGIGGLTLALALARAGVPCRVYEQAENLSEVGAGIQLAPNAVRLLNRLGLTDSLRVIAVAPQAIEIRRWHDDQLLSLTSLGSLCQELYRAPYYTLHRAHLHDVLKRAVGMERVSLGSRLVRVVEQEHGVELHFADSTVRTADLVIGADGIHSAVRDALIRDEQVYSGNVVYRGLIPAERLSGLGRIPKVRIWIGPGKHCVSYPVAGGRLISFAATAPRPHVSESWSADGDQEELLAEYAGWNGTTRRILEAGDSVRCWALHDRDPLRTWCSQRIAVLGDAAHSMLPFLAQGANQAIEDAAALAVCLAQADDIPDALGRYQQLRVPRTTLIQRESRHNARVMHLADGPEQHRRDPAWLGNVQLRRMAWLYGYDVLQEARQAGGPRINGTPASA